MQPDAILGTLEKINDRLGSVEQNLQHLNGQFDRLTRRADTLPTRDEFATLTACVEALPTRDEFGALTACVEALPTRDEFGALTGRVDSLPTRDELDARFDTLRVEFDERVAGLLTRMEFEDRVAGLPTREELKHEHEETHQHIDARFEEVRDRFKILAEGYGHLSGKLDNVHEDLKKDIAGVDRRVMKLEVYTGLIGGH